MVKQSNVSPASSSSPSTSGRFIRDRECRTLTGLSKSTLWRLEKDGRFPRRRKISTRAVGWLSSEVESWIAERAVGLDQ